MKRTLTHNCALMYVCIMALTLTTRSEAQVQLTDNFDGYANQAAFDTAWPPNTAAMTLTTSIRNSLPNSIYQGTVAQRSYRGTASPVSSGNIYFKFNLYDPQGNNSGRSFGTIEARSGSDIAGTLLQLVAIGRYNNISGSKYYGRVANGSPTLGDGATSAVATWFQLGGAANTTVGWHKMEVAAGPNPATGTGTKFWFFVDGVLGGSATVGVTYDFNWVQLGSGITSTGDGAFFDDVVIEALQVPTITMQPTNVTANAGTSATFYVSGTNSNTVATNTVKYQWRHEGTNISGATGSSYTRSNVQQATAGNYTVVVSDAYGAVSIESDIATLTVIDVGPTIVTPPQSVTTNAGWSVLFTVTASGTTPLAYQWRHAGTNISATATASSYTRANVQQATAGNYTVVVSNAYGVVTSAVAVLTVIDTLPIITVQPTNQTVAAGSNVVFRVTTVGSDVRYYQWRYAGTNISGATASSYTRNNAQTNHSGNYQVLITNFLGSVTSEVAVLTVTNTGPIITTQPTASRTAPAGSNVVFSVSTWGTDPRYWQWYFEGSPISGATASSYTRSNAQTNHSGNYQVVISNSLNVVTSALAVLSIYNTNPVLSTQPTSRTVNAGSNVLFTVVSVYGSDPRSYQWRFEGGDIAGATSTSYTRTNAQQAHAGNYSVVVTNEFSALYGGPTTSTNALLTVIDIAPLITTQPASQTKNVGDSVTFTVVATGTTPFGYQWKFGGSNIVSAPNSSSYTRSGLTAADAGNYSVEVSNSQGLTLSSNAVLTVVVPQAPRPVLLPPEISGSTVTIRWTNAVAGTNYRVQYKSELGDANWSNLVPDVVAGGSTASKTDSPVVAKRFYRVIVP